MKLLCYLILFSIFKAEAEENQFNTEIIKRKISPSKIVQSVLVADSGIIVEDCIIRNNTCLEGNGGGISGIDTISVANGILSIRNCQITENTALLSPNGGGGIYLNVLSKPVSIVGCSVIANSTSSTTPASLTFKGGGGIYIEKAIFNEPIKNCIFKDNKLAADIDGAAAYIIPSVTIQNSVFTNNSTESATIQCCVLNLKNVSSVLNCTFAQNATPGAKSGRDINLNNLATSIINCLFWKNISNNTGSTAGANYSIISNSATDGVAFYGTSATFTNNITTLTATNTFVSPTSFNGAPTSQAEKDASALAEWNLKFGCPAINSGKDLSLSPTFITTDILGVSRPQETAFDMGAYEFQTNTEVHQLGKSDFNCYSTHQKIVIDGLNYGDTIKVYGITGNIIFGKQSTRSSESIEVSKGIYLIRVGNMVNKIIVQ